MPPGLWLSSPSLITKVKPERGVGGPREVAKQRTSGPQALPAAVDGGPTSAPVCSILIPRTGGWLWERGALPSQPAAPTLSDPEGLGVWEACRDGVSSTRARLPERAARVMGGGKAGGDVE